MLIGTEDKDLLRLQREARILQTLDHPNIGKVFGFGQLGNNAYILMEWLEGKSLEQLMSEGPVRFDLVSTVVRDNTDALSHAHRMGIVHRDIKPSNIFIEEKDGKSFVRLIDFGIARPMEANQSHTATGTLLGSPAYMSPEQCTKSAIDGRSDIYSLGCVLYQLLSGNYVFGGSTATDIMYRHINESPLPLKPNSSAAKVVMKCLAKSPDQRYQTASQLQRAWMEAPPSALKPLRAGEMSRFVLYPVLALAVFAAYLNISRLQNPNSHRNDTVRLIEDFGTAIKRMETGSPQDVVNICRRWEQRTIVPALMIRVLHAHINANNTLKQSNQSIAIAERVAALAQRVPNHPDLTMVMDKAANVFRNNGLVDKAEVLYQQAIQKRD